MDKINKKNNHEPCNGHDSNEPCGCHDSDEPCNCHDSNEPCGCHDPKESYTSHTHEHDTITLTLDNDDEVVCDVLGIFEHQASEYIALLPKGGEDAFIYQYTELEDGDVTLDNIASQEEFDLISAKFLQLLEEDEKK